MMSREPEFSSFAQLQSFLLTAQALLFDLDGTLFRLPVDWVGIKEHFRDFHKKKYHETLPSLRFFETFDYIRNKFGEKAVSEYFEYVRIKEIEGISSKIAEPTWLASKGLDLLEKFSPSVKVWGVISSNFHETIVKALQPHGIEKKFAIILGRNDVKKPKPNPEGLLFVISKFQLDPNRVLFIGDDWVDEEAARCAQVHFLYLEEIQRIFNSNSIE